MIVDPYYDAYWTKEAIYARLVAGREKLAPAPKLTAQQRAANRWANRSIDALKQDAERTRIALLQERERRLRMSVQKAISNMKPKEAVE
jgi:hypothetical protein